MPQEYPSGFKPTSLSSWLPLSWLLHFFPGSLSTTHPWDHRISNFGLYQTPGMFTEMQTPAPRLPPLPSPGFDLAGLGICIVNKHFNGWVGGFPLKKAGWGKDSSGAKLRETTSSHWVATLCFFTGRSLSSPTYVKRIHYWSSITCFFSVTCQLSKYRLLPALLSQTKKPPLFLLQAPVQQPNPAYLPHYKSYCNIHFCDFKTLFPNVLFVLPISFYRLYNKSVVPSLRC